MLHSNNNIALKRLSEFVGNGLRSFSPSLQTRQPKPDIGIPLTVRVAVTGNLDLTETPELNQAIVSTLQNIQSASSALLLEFAQLLPGRSPSAARLDLRLISSLAAGADQLVARIALDSGAYTLHAVLPFDRAASAQDTGAALQSFNDLIPRCERVIELDGRTNSGAPYQPAAETLLANADILLIVAANYATEVRPGGTRWIQQRAVALELPILEIATNQPAPPKTQEEILQILKRLVLPPTGEIQRLHDSGWFEARFRRTLDPDWNASMWGSRWTQDPAAPIDPGIQDQVDAAYKQSTVWADHRASAYGILARGGFVLVAFLGALAVVLALATPLSIWGKMAEVVVVGVALLVQSRAHHHHWRERWLAYREVERRLDHAAHLGLIGRGAQTRPQILHPAMHNPARGWWVDWYVNAVLRTSRFPSVSLTEEYRRSVHVTYRKSLIDLQIGYFQSEFEENRRTGEWCERWSRLALMTALAITVSFLVAYGAYHYLELEHLHDAIYAFKAFASFCGGALPAIAGALAAIRAYGEYSQHRARYANMIEILETIRERDNRLGLSIPPSSRELAKLGHDTAAILLDEVHTWRVILSEKQIEL